MWRFEATKNVGRDVEWNGSDPCGACVSSILWKTTKRATSFVCWVPKKIPNGTIVGCRTLVLIVFVLFFHFSRVFLSVYGVFD